MPSDVVAWVEWPDFDAPTGVTVAPAGEGSPTGDVLQRITFFVPRYMGGRDALEPATRMPRLSVVQLPTAGYDDALGFLPDGVTLCNARGVHDESTAELAVGLAIAGRRGFPDFASGQAAGQWRHATWPALTDSRIAVVGHGSIGRTVVRMLGGFDVQVTAFSRSGSDGASRASTLSDVIGTFDIVIVVVPLTDQTLGMFGPGLLARMKDGALLVNVSRGAVVDTGALLVELHGRRLHAALDVTDPEPLPADHPLWRAPNVLITPHVGGDTSAFEPRAKRLVHDQLARVVAGEPLTNVVRAG
ncbi:MAG: 2-hydroxyacid dehydrogenase [Actinomycetota bacterium]